jgi:lysophospholipase L1-like esterase
MNRRLLVPIALVGVAGVLSAMGIGDRGQTVVVVGDSLTAQSESQIGLVLTAADWRPVVEGRSGSSIMNRNDVFDWPTRINELAALHPAVVVIELGTNDCGNCGDDLDAGIDRILEPLRHVGRVIWLTAQTADFTKDPGAVNDALRKATGRWSNLELLDMGGHFADHPEWHTDDAVHLNDRGKKELADLIRDALATPLSDVVVTHRARVSRDPRVQESESPQRELQREREFLTPRVA